MGSPFYVTEAGGGASQVKVFVVESGEGAFISSEVLHIFLQVDFSNFHDEFLNFVTSIELHFVLFSGHVIPVVIVEEGVFEDIYVKTRPT